MEQLTGVLAIIIMALILEAVVETLKLIWQDRQLNVDLALAIVGGLVVAFAGGLDLPALLGVSLGGIPYLGIILTGILISRGANFVHDLYKRVESLKNEDLTIIDAVNAIDEAGSFLESKDQNKTQTNIPPSEA